jgi:hypothetical protein
MPNNRGFIVGIRKHKNVEKIVWAEEHNTYGIKNLLLKSNYLIFEVIILIFEVIILIFEVIILIFEVIIF